MSVNVMQLSTNFFSDSFILKLSIRERYIFLGYLLYDKINLLFCFECPDEAILARINPYGELNPISKTELKEFQDKVMAAGKMHFHDDWVILTNAKKHQGRGNYSMQVNAYREYQRLSDEVKEFYLSVFGEEPPAPETQTRPLLKSVEKAPAPKTKKKTNDWFLNLTDEETRDYATTFGISVAEVKDQAEACFKWHDDKGINSGNPVTSLSNWLKKYNPDRANTRPIKRKGDGVYTVGLEPQPEIPKEILAGLPIRIYDPETGEDKS